MIAVVSIGRKSGTSDIEVLAQTGTSEMVDMDLYVIQVSVLRMTAEVAWSCD